MSRSCGLVIDTKPRETTRLSHPAAHGEAWRLGDLTDFKHPETCEIFCESEDR